MENWFCRDRESFYSGTNGWGYGSSIPYSLQEQGAGLLCTEMVSAKAISFHNKNTISLMQIDPVEHPVSMQIFGSEPDLMAEVAKSIEEQPFDILDINMGCPGPEGSQQRRGVCIA